MKFTQVNQDIDQTPPTIKDEVKVSVVIPAYNAAAYLAQTIDSVLAQENVSIEILVVDDCSTDGTAALVHAAASRDARVRYLRMPANSGGPASPRNLGVQNARGQWVALCDADDLWHPKKLLIQLKLVANNKADLVCSAIRDFSENNIPDLSKQQLPTQIPHHDLPYWQMLFKDRIATSSVLCRRTSLLRDGGFNAERELIAVEDYDLWLRLMEEKNFRVLRIKVPLVAYRRLAQSLSASKWRHARKVMRVPRRAAERRGWLWLYPIALPAIFIGYCTMSIYWRVLKGRL